MKQIALACQQTLLLNQQHYKVMLLLLKMWLLFRIWTFLSELLWENLWNRQKSILIIHDCSMSLAVLFDWAYHFFLKWLLNSAYPPFLHGLWLCPALLQINITRVSQLVLSHHRFPTWHTVLLLQGLYTSTVLRTTPSLSKFICLWILLGIAALHLCSKRNFFKPLLF